MDHAHARAHILRHRALMSRGADANSLSWEEIEAAARMQVKTLSI